MLFASDALNTMIVFSFEEKKNDFFLFTFIFVVIRRKSSKWFNPSFF